MRPLITDMDDRVTNTTTAAWTLGGVVGSAASAVVAAAADVPASAWIALVGALGSVIVPCFKILADNQNKALRARLDAATAQIVSLAAERDRLLSLITGTVAIRVPLPVAPEPETPKGTPDVAPGPADGK